MARSLFGLRNPSGYGEKLALPSFRVKQPTLALPKPHMTSLVELCSPDDVPEGAALRVEAGALTVAVFNVEGTFYVTDDACTHGPGSLSEGYIDGDVVECNFHNGQFNIRTGAVVSPPCMVPIKTYPARVEDGKVVIEVD
jgi:nitrite reductase/ring-hydroxylating ferredoxin subunit